VIDPNQKLDFTISPNPGRDRFTVSLNTISDQPFIYEIADMQGRLILRSEKSLNEKELSFDLSDKPTGMYLIRLHFASGQSLSRAFVKEQ
jgi:hypothetical protein